MGGATCILLVSIRLRIDRSRVMTDETICAIDALNTAEVINKFSQTVWVCVDRHAWDQYIQASEGVEDVSKCIFSTEKRG